MIRLIVILTLMLGVSASARTYKPAEIPNVQVADHTKHLSNPDKIVSAATAQAIDSLLLDARRKSSAEIVAVIVDDIDPGDVDDFATELFMEWGLGKKDKNNGILLLVAKDRRRAVIRTGYGAEGVMPDILAGRIIYDYMFPRFREGDYDGGMLAGVQEMHRLVTDPEAAAELMSKLKDNYQTGDSEAEDFFTYYLYFWVFASVVMLALLLNQLYRMRKQRFTAYKKYTALTPYKSIYLALTFFGLGLPLIASLPMVILMYMWRNKPRRCPHCNAKMQKLDEVTDNRYLNAAQDLEEELNSVDYDVWLCPECHETDIYPFVNKASSYQECPNCHARAMKLTGVRDIVPATNAHAGQGEKIYTCLNCNHTKRQKYKIPRKETPVVVVAPGLGGRGRGGFGGGGFGGGFGGGLTGGGGASGGW